METARGAVEADIGREQRVSQTRIELGFVSALMDEAARRERVKEFRAKPCHDLAKPMIDALPADGSIGGRAAIE
jgi:hypothetical protein